MKLFHEVGKIRLRIGGLKLVLIDYMLPILSKNFLVKNHASNIQNFTVCISNFSSLIFGDVVVFV